MPAVLFSKRASLWNLTFDKKQILCLFCLSASMALWFRRVLRANSKQEEWRVATVSFSQWIFPSLWKQCLSGHNCVCVCVWWLCALSKMSLFVPQLKRHLSAVPALSSFTVYFCSFVHRFCLIFVTQAFSTCAGPSPTRGLPDACDQI